MKTIDLELMKGYRYLSNLHSAGGSLYYTETVADIENNDYKQRLHCLKTTGEDAVVWGPQKRIASFTLDDQLWLKKSGEGELIETVYSTLTDGKEKQLFVLPLSSGELKDLNESYYLAEAETDRRCPEYYRLSEQEKKAFHQACSKEEDYLVLDEYPFNYNGVGFINGKRNSLFIIDKKSHEIVRITPETMDVEDVQIHDGKVYLLANDYESMKKMFASIYCYDPASGKLEELYHNDKAYLRAIHIVHGRLYAEGAFDT